MSGDFRGAEDESEGNRAASDGIRGAFISLRGERRVARADVELARVALVRGWGGNRVRVDAWVFELVAFRELVRRGGDHRRIDSGDGDVSRGFSVSVSRAVVLCVRFDTVGGSAGDWMREAFGEEDAREGGEENEGEEREETRGKNGERNEA